MAVAAVVFKIEFLWVALGGIVLEQLHLLGLKVWASTTQLDEEILSEEMLPSDWLVGESVGYFFD